MPSPVKPETTVVTDSVNLKPLFGIKPGIYLTVLYALILLAIILGVLLLPGIISPGSLVRFESEPLGCAVRMDDLYLGVTPFDKFVSAGTRQFSFHSPGFETKVFQITVGRRLFGSLIVPRRQALSATMSTLDPVAVLETAAQDYAAWAAVGQASLTYPIPRVLSEAAWRLSDYAADPAVKQSFIAIFQALARHTLSLTTLGDLSRALFIVSNAGQASSPLNAISGLRLIADYVASAPGAADWLTSILPEASAAVIRDSAWYAQMIADRQALVEPVKPKIPSATPNRQLAGLTFTAVPQGIAIPSYYPHQVELEAFWIASDEVDESSWLAFLAAEPSWQTTNTAELVSMKLITTDYLAPNDNPLYPAPSQSGVSWYAANAYCDWLTKALPAELAGYVVRLPSETEWEYAAEAGLPNVKNLIGGLWEWCANTYVPLDFLPSTWPDFGSDKALRGGSWANRGKMVDSGTRASLSPETCSAFIGFRPIIAKPLD